MDSQLSSFSHKRAKAFEASVSIPFPRVGGRSEAISALTRQAQKPENGRSCHMNEEFANRLKRIETALSDQRVFIHRVPDPDTRERAEGHLIALVQMRDEMVERLGLPNTQGA